MSCQRGAISARGSVVPGGLLVRVGVGFWDRRAEYRGTWWAGCARLGGAGKWIDGWSCCQTWRGEVGTEGGGWKLM